MSKKQILYEATSYDQAGFDYNLWGVLNTFLLVAMFLCDVFVFKTISVFGFPLAVSGAIFPAISLLMIVINEVYGHKKAAMSLLNLIIAQMIFLTFLIIIPKIPSPPNMAENIVSAYNTVFKEEWRVYISSPVGISISLYLTSMINSILKKYFWGNYLFLRALTTSAITTAAMVCIIYPVNFFGIVDMKHIVAIIESTYIYKMVILSTILFLSQPLIALIRKAEKKYIFDINISYSPFHIYSSKSKGVNLYYEFLRKNK